MLEFDIEKQMTLGLFGTTPDSFLMNSCLKSILGTNSAADIVHVQVKLSVGVWEELSMQSMMHDE